MINKFIGIGHLTRDPESKSFTNSNKCSFSVAINTNKDEVLFLDIESWNKVANNCQEYLSKGSCVYVEGKLKLNKWQDPNGNPRQKFYVSADIVRFLPNSKKQAPPTKVENSSPKPNIQSIVEDTEMPF
jgi:single-strand DNA-binding protein